MIEIVVDKSLIQVGDLLVMSAAGEVPPGWTVGADGGLWRVCTGDEPLHDVEAAIRRYAAQPPTSSRS